MANAHLYIYNWKIETVNQLNLVCNIKKQYI